MKRQITPEVLDRLIATAEGNITKTKEKPGRIWFDRSDRVREMEQTTQALKEFRKAMRVIRLLAYCLSGIGDQEREALAAAQPYLPE